MLAGGAALFQARNVRINERRKREGGEREREREREREADQSAKATGSERVAV